MSVEVLLTEDGRSMLQLASVIVPESPMMPVFVTESEDMGLWIRVERDLEMYLFLLRWEYILGIAMPGNQRRPIGWKTLGGRNT